MIVNPVGAWPPQGAASQPITSKVAAAISLEEMADYLETHQ
jgi:hypothetical protein